MGNTVINIYGDLHINIHQTVNVDGNLVDVISSAIEGLANNIDDENGYNPRLSDTNGSCVDPHGRWSNEAERDAWHRFYTANTY